MEEKTVKVTPAFHGRLLQFSWPLFLIALGVWLIIRRMGDTQGGPK